MQSSTPPSPCPLLDDMFAKIPETVRQLFGQFFEDFHNIIRSGDFISKVRCHGYTLLEHVIDILNDSGDDDGVRYELVQQLLLLGADPRVRHDEYGSNALFIVCPVYEGKEKAEQLVDLLLRWDTFHIAPSLPSSSSSLPVGDHGDVHPLASCDVQVEDKITTATTAVSSSQQRCPIQQHVNDDGESPLFVCADFLLDHLGHYDGGAYEKKSPEVKLGVAKVVQRLLVHDVSQTLLHIQ